MIENQVINIRADQEEFSELYPPDPRVTTIVMGDSPTDSGAAKLSVSKLPLFETEHPNLGRLHLWNVADLERIPALSANARFVEVRSCPDLTTIDSLPRSLETIVLEDCPQLVNMPEITGHEYPQLRELSLAGCGQIEEEWIHQLVDAAPHLKLLNLSRCRQIRSLGGLPKNLERLELNECSSLAALPTNWPLKLERLGLRKATSVSRIPELRKAADHVDLAFTPSLCRLPALPQSQVSPASNERRPRTLYLFGSGVLEPPASEHGDTPESNVAVDIREYHDEVRLVGKGSVRRCKLLLLGNGEAGKTYLALRLNPKFSIEQDYRGSTHGVQFWSWPDFRASSENEVAKVNLHMWDFGGQEIYHSTHRLFVSRGSIFVVVWKPEQDGKQPPPKGSYQDRWMPIRYWLDYIYMESPHVRPLVAVVCSHQGDQWQARKDELNQRFRHQVGDDYADQVPLFVFDAAEDAGERMELEKWISARVSSVVVTQGTIVPTYWEIAQNMVEGWLPKPDRVAQDEAEHALLEAQFADRLKTAADQALANEEQDTDLSDLRQNWKAGGFLTPRRVQRTLRFLTRSGWLYWDPLLFQSKVIIDQPWALEKIYTTLERREDAWLFKQLKANKGRFNLTDLQTWCWSRDEMDESDQQLILSYMLSVGVCFPLSNQYSTAETVYISPTHLPPIGEMSGEFQPFDVDREDDHVASTQLHRGHWFAVMRALCKRYGEDGTYSKDACLIRGSTYRWDREHGQWAALFRLRMENEKLGLGGKISISVQGGQVDERLTQLKRFVESFMPGFEGNPSDAVTEFDREFHGCVEDAKTVFFSYAWDPEDQQADYEEPVNAVHTALLEYQRQGRVKLLRDKMTMKPGDYISRFIRRPKDEKVDLVIVFTSEKYWRSWFCMIELEGLIKSLSSKGKSYQESVLVIEHETGRLHSVGDAEPLVNYWDSGLEMAELRGVHYPKSFPGILKQEKFAWDLLRDGFIDLINHHATKITSDTIGIRKTWNPDDEGEIVEWVKKKLGLADR